MSKVQRPIRVYLSKNIQSASGKKKTKKKHLSKHVPNSHITKNTDVTWTKWELETFTSAGDASAPRWKMINLNTTVRFSSLTCRRINQAVVLSIWQHSAARRSPATAESPTFVSEVLCDCDISAFCCLRQSQKKNKKNSTAYVDNQINTNVLYTIRYKKGKKAHESISGSWRGRMAERNHNRAGKKISTVTDAEETKEA